MNDIITHLDWSFLTDLLASAIPALVCIVIHEMSHGYAAYRLGDPTPKRDGRLSLNPIRHIDVFGLLMLMVLHFGWAKPVSVDTRYFRNPKRDMAITALAGPASNFILAAVVMFFYGFLYIKLNSSSVGGFVLDTMYTTALFSVSLGLFNLIPIPPLDGSKVLFSILPERMYFGYMRYERYGMLLLLLLVMTSTFSRPLYSATGTIMKLMLGIARWSFGLTA